MPKYRGRVKCLGSRVNWHRGENTRLTMQLGIQFQPGAICGLSMLFACALLQGFFSEFSGVPASTNLTKIEDKQKPGKLK